MFDTYTRRARIWPPLLVALPGALAAVAWFPEAPTVWSAVSGLVVASGVPALLAQIGRDWGKTKQTALWETWGGPPTTRLLRHRGTKNKVILARRHQRLRKLVPGIKIPSPEQEEKDSEAADQIYEACGDFLRARTRDSKKFLLIFEENCSYGLRRNLWGMKPLGVTVSLLSTVAVIVLIIMRYRTGEPPPPLAFASGLANILLLGTWVFWITSEWVRLSADAYAEQLLVSCDQIQP